MPADPLGWRCKMGVVAPSTNTIVQPDLEALRPEGVTNHHARITVPNMRVSGDADFVALVEALGAALDDAVDRVMTAQPDHLVQGVSALSFWGGRDTALRRHDALAERIGVPVSAGSFACEAVLRAHGARRIAVLSPYFPVSDREVTRFFTDCGFDIAALTGLRRPTPIAIAETPAELLLAEVARIDGPDIDGIVQVGTNLSFRQHAEDLSRSLGKPVIAVNAATYWFALRSAGIEDRLPGASYLPDGFPPGAS